jgi:hypothetical protein
MKQPLSARWRRPLPVLIVATLAVAGLAACGGGGGGGSSSGNAPPSSEKAPFTAGVTGF